MKNILTNKGDYSKSANTIHSLYIATLLSKLQATDWVNTEKNYLQWLNPHYTSSMENEHQYLLSSKQSTTHDPKFRAGKVDNNNLAMSQLIFQYILALGEKKKLHEPNKENQGQC